MKKLFNLFKRILFCFFIIYGFNMIGVNFNFILPINIFSLLIVFIFGLPGFVCLILFKIIL